MYIGTVREQQTIGRNVTIKLGNVEDVVANKEKYNHNVENSLFSED